MSAQDLPAWLEASMPDREPLPDPDSASARLVRQERRLRWRISNARKRERRAAAIAADHPTDRGLQRIAQQIHAQVQTAERETLEELARIQREFLHPSPQNLPPSSTGGLSA